MNTRKNVLAAVGVLCLLWSAACEETPSDAYSSNRDPAPDGAEMIDEATYRAYVNSGDWFVLTQRTAAEMEAKEMEQDAADEKTIADYMQLHPGLDALVPIDPPGDDPTVTRRDDGNFDHIVELPGDETLRVVTHGRRWWLRVIANGIRVFPTRDNQLALYRGIFEGLPEDIRERLELRSPDEMAADAGVTAEDIMRINKMLAEPVTANTIIDALKLDVDIVLPPMFLSDCDDEAGHGTAGDLSSSKFDGSCDFGANSIVRHHNWPLRPYLTCVKSQGARGTCTGFACTSCIEILVGKTHGQRVNLSEQALYNRARTKWDAPYGTLDGLMGERALQGMQDENWLLYFENQWNYNPSSSRMTMCTQSNAQGSCVMAEYSKSCFSYTETCSDTVHQSQIYCLDNGAWLFCGYLVPEKNPGNLGYRIGNSSQFWDPNDPMFSLFAMKLCLVQGYPVVLGMPVTTAWDCAEITNTQNCPAAGRVDGYMPYKANDTNRGGHGTCALGFIDNGDLADILPDAPPGEGGGYIIVKNSWGNCWGDGGFIYVPYQAIIDYAADTTVLFSVL